MMLLVSGRHRALYDDQSVGHLLCPRSRNLPWSATWAADNSAFSSFDESAWLRMLDRIAFQPGCLFVTLPDVVGNASRTLALYHQHVGRVLERGLPPGFVLQNGITHTPGVPNDAVALFLGGDTAFKLGPVARQFAGEARRRGLWVHMGRVNSTKRVQYAAAIGCHSVDGSGFAKFADVMFPRFAEAVRRPMLEMRA